MQQPRGRRPSATGAAVLLGTNLVWAAGYPATALALRGMTPAFLALLRLAVGAAALAPHLRPTPWRARGALAAAALGLVGYTLPIYLQILGLARSSPAAAALFVALEPLLTALLAAWQLHEPIPRPRQAALALAALGAWTTAGFPRPGVHGQLGGIALLLLATGGFAAYNVFSAPLAAHLGPARATAATLGAGALGMLPLWLATGARLPLHATAVSWTAAAFLALPGTAGAYLAWNWAVSRLPVSFAALSLYVQPVCGALLSIAVLRMQPSWGFDLGALAILGALVLGRERRPSPRDRAGAPA